MAAYKRSTMPHRSIEYTPTHKHRIFSLSFLLRSKQKDSSKIHQQFQTLTVSDSHRTTITISKPPQIDTINHTDSTKSTQINTVLRDSHRNLHHWTGLALQFEVRIPHQRWRTLALITAPKGGEDWENKERRWKLNRRRRWRVRTSENTS